MLSGKGLLQKPKMKLPLLIALSILCGLRSQSAAVDFSEEKIGETRVTVCRVKVKEEKLELFLRDDKGQPFKRLETLVNWLDQRGRKLTFAMNAGMYHADFSPVGLFVANGKEVKAVNLDKGEDNFFWKPNGVFVLTASGARVVESSEYLKLREPVLLATQSGPLLLRNGQMHVGFKPGSAQRLVRNGVGVPSPDIAIFTITEGPVNFHDYATFYRDTLHCPDALFFDGTISSLHAPQLNRSDAKIDVGPIIGIAP